MESGMKAQGIVAIVTALALTSCERDEVPPVTKLDAQQAIAVVPGSPQGVRLDSRGGKPEFEVMIVPSGGRVRVRVDVDANSGQIHGLPSGERDRDDE